MTKIRNISTGPRGAYAGSMLVMAERGQTIEADDFAPEWFEEVGVKSASIEDAGKSEPDIAAALALLDPGDDAHWTEAGLPAVDAVSDVLGEKVTRAQIAAAAPDAKRPE